MALLHQINRQFAVTGTQDVLAQLGLVAGEDGDSFSATGNGHIPLLLVRGRFDGGIGEQDMIDRLALGRHKT